MNRVHIFFNLLRGREEGGSITHNVLLSSLKKFVEMYLVVGYFSTLVYLKFKRAISEEDTQFSGGAAAFNVQGKRLN